ncbi:MAG: DNA repair protein RecO [Bacillota bacterium]|nr:DNA repair protein RecO [Bacillota bacterium]
MSDFEAIILRSRDYKDQDKLLTFISAEQGKGLAIARGARKPSGSLRPVTQPYCRARLSLSPPRDGVAFIEQGIALESYVSLDANLAAMTYAAYFAELTELTAAAGRAAPELYLLVLAAFSLLKLDSDHRRSARFFEVRLLAELGLLPPLDSCNNCGRKLNGGDFFLDAEAGGLYCGACVNSGAPRLSAGAAQTLRRLAEVELPRLPQLKINPAIGDELEQALSVYLRYHLDYTPKSAAFLRGL